MTGTCRAAVFRGDETDEIREFPIPDPPPGGAVLQVEAVGLCGSDVPQFAGIELVPGACAFPVVSGHETVGRVAKLATDAALGVAEGDRVAVNEIMPGVPMRLYGYSDMTGDGEVTGTSQDGLRLDAAKEIGATAVVMVDVDDAGEVVRDLTRGAGADVVFDVATTTQTVRHSHGAAS